jgi:uncharacterized membrane protein
VTFHEWMQLVVRVFEVTGALVLLAGLVVSTLLAVADYRAVRDGRRAYRVLRESFGGVILLGLEILVAADLVQTVTVEPTLRNVVTLGLVVLIRTLLSFSLEVEVEGVAPWRRAATTGTGRVGQAVARSRERP